MSLLRKDRGKQDYRAVPLTESISKTRITLAEVGRIDRSPSCHTRHATTPGHISQNLGTLSRSNESSWYFLAQGAVDAGLAIGPIFFFIIAGLCVGLHKQPKAPYGDKIQSITLLSPTIFPIVYAAILGKLLRRIGLFKAERGTTMGSLERLIGCQSLFSAVERQVGLRRVDLLGFSILIAWFLSPLGGQASLRLLSIEPLYQNSDSTMYYWPATNYPTETALPIGRANMSNSPFFAPLFVAALETSRLNFKTPMDLFGNVKIPDYNATTNPPENSEHSWQVISQKQELVYTSVLGIPIAGIPESGSTSFTITSHYWSIDCDRTNSTKRQTAWTRTSPQNGTLLTDAKPLSPSFNIVVDTRNSSNVRIKFAYLSRTFIEDFFVPGRGKAWINAVNCSASPVVVDSMIHCLGRSCFVRAMRTANRTITQIWNHTNYQPLDFFQAIGQRMPGVDVSATQDQQFGSELIEHWIQAPGLDKKYSNKFLDMSNLDHDFFVQNLQMVINTFWDSTVGRNIRTGNLDISNVAIMQPAWQNMTITASRNEGLHYVCHFYLAGITMAISFILLLAANLSLLLGLLSKTPDALGFVSMAARDNPYFKRHVPSHFDGKETARLLRDVKVRVGDVRPDDEVGHIALATMDAEPRRLSWTKVYD